MTTTKRPGRSPQAPDAAAQLTAAIHGLGNYAHVTVELHRSSLHVQADGEPVARLTPLAEGRYGLSFHHHSGRWEPTPFTGDIAQLAGVLVTEFGAYLDCYDFPPTKSGFDH